MAQLWVLRVFVGPDGAGGNPLGVFPDGSQVPPGERQGVARELGFAETVYVDDVAAGAVQIFTPDTELPFAGHPLVGTAWLLAHTGTPVDVLRPPAGLVPTWEDDSGRRWIRGRAEWAPTMDLVRLDTPQEVESLTGSPDGQGFAYCWAWIDEEAGVVRARAFAPAIGVDEDEATGAAAVRLATALDRPLRISQGQASELYARPGPSGTAEVGGTVEVDERREHLVRV